MGSTLLSLGAGGSCDRIYHPFLKLYGMSSDVVIFRDSPVTVFRRPAYPLGNSRLAGLKKRLIKEVKSCGNKDGFSLQVIFY